MNNSLQTTETFYHEMLRVSDVPTHLHDGIVKYLAHGILPGGFLLAVLENDLKEAVKLGDERSCEGLASLVRWLYQIAPATSWGSEEAITTWLITMRQLKVGV